MVGSGLNFDGAIVVPGSGDQLAVFFSTRIGNSGVC